MAKLLDDAYGDIFDGTDLVKFVRFCSNELSLAEEIELRLTGAVKTRRGKVNAERLDKEMFGFLGGEEADILYMKKYSSSLFSPIVSQATWLEQSLAYLDTIGLNSTIASLAGELIKEEGYLNVWMAVFFVMRRLSRMSLDDVDIDNVKLAVILEADTNDLLLDAVDGVSLVQGIIYLACSTVRFKMTHEGFPFAVYHRAFFDGYLDRLHYVDVPEHFVDERVMVKGEKIEDVVVPFLCKAGVLKMPESLVL